VRPLPLGADTGRQEPSEIIGQRMPRVHSHSFLDGSSLNRNPKKFRAIRLDIREFNAKIRDLRLQGEVSLITYESMRRQAKGMVRAGKKEMRMLQ